MTHPVDEIRTGHSIVLPDGKPRLVTFIDMRLGPCPACDHPTRAVRLLLDDGVLTVCPDAHVGYRSFLVIDMLLYLGHRRIKARLN